MSRPKPHRQWLARLAVIPARNQRIERQAASIETDAYDRAALAGLLQSSPSLQAAASSGRKLLPHFDALLLDLFALLYKAQFVLQPADRILPSALLPRAIVEAILAAPALEVLRCETVLDEHRSAVALALLAEDLLAMLKTERLVNRLQMLDFWALSDQEAELSRIGQQLDAVEDLAARMAKPHRSSLDQLFHRLEREAAVLGRSHGFRSQDAARVAREVSTRHAKDLAASVCNTVGAVQEVDGEQRQWTELLGTGESASPGLQIELGKRLASNPKLRKLARFVGRMRARARALRAHLYEKLDEETHTVTAGSDLSRLLPCELGSLRHPLRRRDFGRRLLEGTLLQYELRGTERRERGPIVACVDVSASMSGDKEIWAKAIALTLLDIATRERRAFRVLCFSSSDTPLLELELNPQQRYQPDPFRVLDFATYFPGGGTDFQKPLEAALATLERHRFRNADLVFLTDGECRFQPEWIPTFQEAKRRLGFRLFSVLIDVGTADLAALQTVSDRITSVRRLTAEDGSELFLSL